MYAGRLGATEHPDAPQALERRMTHPVTTFAATAPGRVPANARSRYSCGRTRSVTHSVASVKSSFYNRVAIFLEMRRAPFHYSVIGWDTRIHLAPGLAECHLLNDDVSASSSRGGTAGAWAPAGDE
jgi:hypothetical protein